MAHENTAARSGSVVSRVRNALGRGKLERSVSLRRSRVIGGKSDARVFDPPRVSTTSKAYQYRTPWDRPVTSTFTVQSRSALAVAMPALATLDESDQPKTVEPGAIGTRDPSATGLASGSTAADVGGVVATLHRTSKDTFGSGSVSPGSRPVGVTRVQMTMPLVRGVAGSDAVHESPVHSLGARAGRERGGEERDRREGRDHRGVSRPARVRIVRVRRTGETRGGPPCVAPWVGAIQTVGKKTRRTAKSNTQVRRNRTAVPGFARSDDCRDNVG